MRVTRYGAILPNLQSEDIASALTTVKAPKYVDMLTVSPNRTLIALGIDGQAGRNHAVAVRNSLTLEHAQCWQTPAEDFFVTGVTWLNDRQLAMSLCETYTRRTKCGEVVILQLGSTSRRRVKLEFEPWSILAIAPNRLAVADRDGGVRVIQLDP